MLSGGSRVTSLRSGDNQTAWAASVALYSYSLPRRLSFVTSVWTQCTKTAHYVKPEFSLNWERRETS